jgi:hypothetical protein
LQECSDFCDTGFLNNIDAAERAARAAERVASRQQGYYDENDEDEDEEAEICEDEDEVVVGNESKRGGAASMTLALEALALAREQLGTAEGHIRSYARSFQFDAAEHQELSDRLKVVSCSLITLGVKRGPCLHKICEVYWQVS